MISAAGAFSLSVPILQQKSVARRKCAGCKISVHTMCMEQLEKVWDVRRIKKVSTLADDLKVLTLSCLSVQINFRCKPSFREPGSRAIREVRGYFFTTFRPETIPFPDAFPLSLSFCVFLFSLPSATRCDTTGSTEGARLESVGSAGR